MTIDERPMLPSEWWSLEARAAAATDTLRDRGELTEGDMGTLEEITYRESRGGCYGVLDAELCATSVRAAAELRQVVTAWEARI